MTTVRMSIEDWIKVQDNPRQRDTERHAERAKHLRTPSPEHACVAAAKLPNGKLIKLDGHTRALLWKRREVERPKTVEVSVIPVKSEDQAKELYTHYDSKFAVETATDKISGGFNEIGFEPESGLLRSGRIGSALRIAWTALHGYSNAARAKDTYAMVNEFAAEILALDDLALTKNATKSGIIAAFILTYRKHGESALPFWRAVFSDSGSKANGQMDAAQALNELILQRRDKHGGQASQEMCCRALRACEHWLQGDMLQGVPRPLDLISYLTKKENKKAA